MSPTAALQDWHTRSHASGSHEMSFAWKVRPNLLLAPSVLPWSASAKVHGGGAADMIVGVLQVRAAG